MKNLRNKQPRSAPIRHAFLGTHPPQEDMVAYLDSLALIARRSSDAGDTTRSHDAAFAYLERLATAFGAGDIGAMANGRAARSPNKSLQRLPALLRRPDIAWTWLADATFVACLCGHAVDAVSEKFAPQATSAGLSVDEVGVYIARIATIAKQDDPARIIDAIRAVCAHGGGWKAIVDYRGISFAEPLRGLCDKLDSVPRIVEQSRLAMEMTKERWNVLNCMSGLDPEGLAGLVGRAAVGVNRRLRVAAFEGFRRKVEAFASHDAARLREARDLVRAFDLPLPEPRVPALLAAADRDVRYANEQWTDRMNLAYDELEAYLDDHGRQLSETGERLERIRAGRW